MKYMLLLYGKQSQAPQYSPEEAAVARQSWFTLVDEMKAAGVYDHNYGLVPVSKATTVRVRDGKITTSQGPFAEAPEDFSGYFMIDCNNLDEAIGWAAKIPYATGGSIEVRPVASYT